MRSFEISSVMGMPATVENLHDPEGFGSCSTEGECEAVCPKEIPITNIARMNRDYLERRWYEDADRGRAGSRTVKASTRPESQLLSE